MRVERGVGRGCGLSTGLGEGHAVSCRGEKTLEAKKEVERKV